MDFLLTFFCPLMSSSKNDVSQVETTDHQRIFNSFSRAVNQARDGLARDDVVHRLGWFLFAFRWFSNFFSLVWSSTKSRQKLKFCWHQKNWCSTSHISLMKLNAQLQKLVWLRSFLSCSCLGVEVLSSLIRRVSVFISVPLAPYTQVVSVANTQKPFPHCCKPRKNAKFKFTHFWQIYA